MSAGIRIRGGCLEIIGEGARKPPEQEERLMREEGQSEEKGERRGKEKKRN